MFKIGKDYLKIYSRKFNVFFFKKSSTLWKKISLKNNIEDIDETIIERISREDF